MRLCFRFRLYPSKDETEKLIWTLERACELYNACLQERRDAWTNIRRHPNFYDPEWLAQAKKAHHISLYDQQNQLSTMKRERTEYLELSAAHILNDVCSRVDRAFNDFFERVKAGKKAGYPRFHSYKRYHSICYPDRSGWKLLESGKAPKRNGKRTVYLSLRRIGEIKMRLHRPIEGVIKTVTIKREGTEWYAVFSCEVAEREAQAATEETVGVHLGTIHFAALSTGETVAHPHYYRKVEKKMAAAQQVLSRKKEPHSKPKGKNKTRRQKVVERLARLHRKARQQRHDFLHKTSRRLVNTYDTLVFGEYDVISMMQRPEPIQDRTGKYLHNGAEIKAALHKQIADAGWKTFQQYCTYKAAYAGRQVLVVDPKDIGHRCSGCGRSHKKGPEERQHTCECGLTLDRSVNAAKNLLILGTQQREAQKSAQAAQDASHQQQDEAGPVSASVSSFVGERRAAEPSFVSAPAQAARGKSP